MSESSIAQQPPSAETVDPPGGGRRELAVADWLALVSSEVEHLCGAVAWWADRANPQTQHERYVTGARESVDTALVSIDAIEAQLTRVRQQLRAEAGAFDDARLLATATGNGATHDWDTGEPGLPRCRRCKTKAGQPTIRRGQVPLCTPEERCPTGYSLGWHEITSDAAGASCIFCGTAYTASGQAVSR